MRVTRRNALKGMASSLALAAAPRVALFAQAPTPLMLQLSTYMADAAARSLPPDAVEHAKHHILDTIAAMFAARQTHQLAA